MHGSLTPAAIALAGALCVVSTSPSTAQDAAPAVRPPAVAQATTQAAPAGAAQEPPAREPESAPWYEQLSFNAFLSTAYSVNANRPLSRTNQFRTFDTEEGTFSLDVAEVVVQRAIEDPGQAGFRVDLAVGSALPRVTAATGLFRDEAGEAGDFDIRQGYFSYIAPVGRGLRIDVGKFDTHLGFEVVEGYDGYNDQYSHSFQFGYAEPVTHTGLRLQYPWSDTVDLVVLLVNGWDNAKDNNTGKSVGAGLTFRASPALSLTVNYLGGPEQDDNNSNLRHAVNVMGTAKVTPDITLSACAEYGREAQVLLAETAGGARTDADWGGMAGYARYQATPRTAFTFRGEWFSDPRGARTGVGQQLAALTVTPEYKLTDHVVLRAELRRDWSNRDVFELSDGGFGRSQVTVALNGLFVF